MEHQAWIEMITEKSRQADLPPEMILAIIETESDGNPYAATYHANYSWINMQTKRPAACHPNTESVLQRTAWGLMQIMGATARDMGFDEWLTELTIPVVNIAIGMKYLAGLSERYLESHGIDGVIAAYNAGSPKKTADGKYRNQAYVDKVKNLMLKYAALIPEKVEEAKAENGDAISNPAETAVKEEIPGEAESVKPADEVTATADAETSETQTARNDIPEDLSKLTKDELMKKVEELGIPVPPKAKKEDLVALIVGHTTVESTTPES